MVDCSSKLYTFSIDGTRHVASAPVVAMIRDFVFVRNGVCAKGSGSPQLLPSGSTRRAPWGS